MIPVSYDTDESLDFQANGTPQGRSEEGLSLYELEKLLGMLLYRCRPQSGTDSACQNHRVFDQTHTLTYQITCGHRTLQTKEPAQSVIDLLLQRRGQAAQFPADQALRNSYHPMKPEHGTGLETSTDKMCASLIKYRIL